MMLHEHDPGDISLPLDALAGPAKRISSAQGAAMIDAALDVAFAPAASRAGRRWPTLVLAAAVVGAAGAAAVGVYRLAVSDGSSRGATPARSGSTAHPAPPAPGAAADAGPEPTIQPAGADTAAGPAGPEVAPAPSPAAAELDTDDTDDGDTDDAGDGDADDGVTDGAGEAPRAPAATPARPARPRVRRAPAPAPAPASAARTPEDLMRLANDQRRARSWARADALYRQLMREHAGTRAAYVAGVASAAIRLDHLGDARGALRLYRAALRDAPRGVLAEEARYGVAEALRRLGDAAGERRALEAFLSRHGDSPLAPRARERLAELKGAPR